MTFIEVGSTLFNLTHIRKVRRIWSRGKNSHVVIEYVNGETESLEHEDAYRSFGGLESNDATTIPAAAGFMTVNCWFWDEPPSLENINRDPIIGWRTYQVGNTTVCDPITLDDGPSTDSGSTAILRPDGVVVVQALQQWDSIEEWMKTVREDWEKWKKTREAELVKTTGT
jgi:hypothetical protein